MSKTTTTVVQTKGPSKGQRQRKNRQAKKNNLQPMPKPASVPVSKTATFRQTNPKITQTDHKSCRIHHRELFTALTPQAANPAYVPQQWPINPGIPTVFPWLSNIAVNWEQYRFNKLVFHFLTRCPSNQVGSFMVAPDYDAADAAPIDEVTMMTYEGARQDSVWKDVHVVCDVKALLGGMQKKFVRSAAPAANLDIKMYDGGNLFTAFDVVAVGVFLKAYVEYDVTFFTPQLPAAGPPLAAAMYTQAGGTFNAAAPLGTVPVNSATNILANTSYSAITGNFASLLQDVADGVYAFNFGGTGITQNVTASLTDSAMNPVAGTISVVQGVINAAGTAAQALFRIKGAKQYDQVNLSGISATTIAGASAYMLKGNPGL
jgi:hypothetical protein